MNTTASMSHKEVAKHIRTRLSASGISAKCSIYSVCGVRYIKVSTPKFDVNFSDEQSREINLIAKVNGLTSARGSEIDVSRVCTWGGVFEFHN